MKWLVYFEVTYYPWASIVEADTPEEARDAVPEAQMTGEYGAPHAIAVCPLEQVTLYGDTSYIDGHELIP